MKYRTDAAVIRFSQAGAAFCPGEVVNEVDVMWFRGSNMHSCSIYPALWYEESPWTEPVYYDGLYQARDEMNDAFKTPGCSKE